MSRFTDLSQLSDLQNISRISRLNCSRMMGRVDSLQNLYEPQHSFTSNASRNVTNSNQGTVQTQKAVKYLTLCEESIGEYAKSKIILDCLKEASLNAKRSLSAGVVTKLQGLLQIHEVNKYMHLPSNSKNAQEESMVLGITDLPKYDFTYEETLSIKCCVETILREKIQKFLLRYEELGGNMKEVLRSTDCNMRKKLFEPHDVQLLQWKDKIEELCAQYRADIAKCRILINNWNQLKYQDISRTYSEQAEYMLLQAQVAEVQAKITKLSCIMRMYKETPVTIDAHRILNTAIDEKLFAVMNEIKEKENLKKQYENLQNTEYDEILKTYLHFCQAIKKKKKILEQL